MLHYFYFLILGLQSNALLPFEPCKAVAHYTFDDANAKDISGQNNHAIKINASPTRDRHGNENKAYYFDGIDDYIEIANHESLNFKNEFTLAAWIKADAGYGDFEDGHIDIVSKWGIGGEGNAAYLMGVDNTGKLLGFAYNPKNSLYGAASNAFSTDVWHHIVVVKNETKMAYYCDGILLEKKDCTFSVQQSHYPLFIGAEPVGGNYFKGCIDDVQLFSCALSDAQVAKLGKE